MRIEHIGLSVPEPQAMAQWYHDHLGFTILLAGGDGRSGVAFITDDAGEIMLELFRLEDTPVTDYRAMAPLQLHLAVKTDDPDSDCARLAQAGATILGECERKGPGDRLVLLRDPWGMVIQLVKRGKTIQQINRESLS